MKTVISEELTPDVLDIFNAYLSAQLSISECMAKLADSEPKHKDLFLTISSALADGESLESQLRKYKVFPEQITELIASGSAAGQLEETIEQIIDNQREINDLSTKTRRSLMTQSVTIAVALLSTPYLLIFMSEQSKDDGLAMVVKYINIVIDFVPYAAYVYPLVIFTAFFSIFIVKEVQETILNFLSVIPYIKRAITNWQLGIWSSSMSLSTRSGLSFAMAEPLLRPFLTGNLKEAIFLLNKHSLESGWAEALNSKEWEEDDPRHILPDLFKTSLLSGAATGDFSKQLSKISVRMLKESQKSFAIITQISFYLIMFLAAGIVLYLAITIMTARMASIG